MNTFNYSCITFTHQKEFNIFIYPQTKFGSGEADKMLKGKNPPKKGEKDMDDLKQELEMDEHRITFEELYARYKTDPDKVCDFA